MVADSAGPVRPVDGSDPAAGIIVTVGVPAKGAPRGSTLEYQPKAPSDAPEGWVLVRHGQRDVVVNASRSMRPGVGTGGSISERTMGILLAPVARPWPNEVNVSIRPASQREWIRSYPGARRSVAAWIAEAILVLLGAGLTIAPVISDARGKVAVLVASVVVLAIGGASVLKVYFDFNKVQETQ